MGLLLITARFPGGSPPAEAEFRKRFLEGVGSLRGLDDYSIRCAEPTTEDALVDVTTDPDPVNGGYARKILRELGGEEVCRGTPPPLPWFVSKPWTAWPWWRRAGVWLGIVAGFWIAIVREMAAAVRRRWR